MAEEIVELKPYALAVGGEAVARRADGSAVLIAGALPGEHVRATILGKKGGFVRTRLVEILEVSPERVNAPCPEVVRGCGSCQWQHISLDGQRRLKRKAVENALAPISGLSEPVVGSLLELSPWGYRTTVRAAVVEGRAGYRRLRAHSVVPVESCLVAHPLVEDLLINGRFGSADEVVLRCGARTGERLAVADPETSTMNVPSDVRSDYFHEQAAGRTWRISAHSFFQSRPDGADLLAALVRSAADECGGQVGIDLYSGVGVFAGALADRGWSMTAVETSMQSVEDAIVNLRGDDVQIVKADVSVWDPSKADFVVANPGRRGLGKRGTSTVQAARANRVVLVSCDVTAFGRDVKLIRALGYSLTSVTPVDMFSHTFHVEVVSVFDR